ncbi:hypothetical protein ACFPRL_35970 [Pseudoclavibacter helvolus]
MRLRDALRQERVSADFRSGRRGLRCAGEAAPLRAPHGDGRSVGPGSTTSRA